VAAADVAQDPAVKRCPRLPAGRCAIAANQSRALVTVEDAVRVIRDQRGLPLPETS
jgi:hypothetical protein